MPCRRAAKSASSSNPSTEISDRQPSLLPHHLGLARMPAGSLRQNEETPEYKDSENRRRKRPAQGKATMVSRLVGEVADGRAQRAMGKIRHCRDERGGGDDCRPI